MENEIQLLKKIPVFSDLSEKLLYKMSQLEYHKQYNKGEIIFTEGDKGEAIYFVKSGKVKIYKTSIDGREIILNIFGYGSVFAEVTLFNDIYYPATAEVIENAEIGMIYNKDIEEVVVENPELALQIIKILSKRLHRSQANVKELALSDTYIRTAKVLMDLGEKHGKMTSKGIVIDMDVTRQDIANIVGTVRETVSRAMSQLKKQGIIDTKGKTIVIIDQEALEELVDDM